MEKDGIQDGDVVMLKSGGPTMTVRAIVGGEAYCDWFDEKEHKTGKFKPCQFTKAGEATEPRVTFS